MSPKTRLVKLHLAKDDQLPGFSGRNQKFSDFWKKTSYANKIKKFRILLAAAFSLLSVDLHSV